MAYEWKFKLDVLNRSHANLNISVFKYTLHSVMLCGTSPYYTGIMNSHVHSVVLLDD